MKNTFCALVAFVGGLIAESLGGWDTSLTTLLIIMIVDFVTGLMVAGLFHQSPKTATGTLESNVCFKGLCKKMFALLCVLIGYRLDILTGVSYIRDTVCIGFITSDLISIVENAGLMGLPVPAVIVNVIDVLKTKSE